MVHCLRPNPVVTVCLFDHSVATGKGAVDAGSGTDRATKKLGMRLLPSVIGEMALLRADRLLIPVFASYHQLGIYVVASTMAELASWPLLQYIDSYTPRWAAQFVDGTLSPLRLFLRTCVFSLCVSASVAMPVYFAIPLLFGSAYDESASLIPILSAATAFFGMSRVADRPRYSCKYCVLAYIYKRRRRGFVSRLLCSSDSTLWGTGRGLCERDLVRHLRWPCLGGGDEAVQVHQGYNASLSY